MLLLLGAIPWLPWLPGLWQGRAMPYGLIHIIIASQALPLLVRIAAGRTRVAADGPTWSWTLLGAIAFASALVNYAAYSLIFDSSASFWTEIAVQAGRYVFERPGLEMENMIVATTTVIDGLLVYLLVRAYGRAAAPSASVAPAAGTGVAGTGARGTAMAGRPVTASVVADGTVVDSAAPAATAASAASAAPAVPVDRGDLWLLTRTLCLGGLGVALFACYQLETRMGLSRDWLANDPLITRVNATYTDPNALAAYFALVIPATLGLAGASAGRRRLLWGAASALMFAALVMTAGRAGMLALLAGAAVLGAGAIALGLDRRDAWPPVRRWFRRGYLTVALLAVVGVATLIGVGTALDVRHHQQRSYLHTWLYTANLRQPPDEIFKGRLAIWQTAALMVRERPGFGIGVGRMLRLFTNYHARVGGMPEGIHLSAHNTFLNVAAELGLVGLSAWLLLIGAIGVMAVRALRALRAAGRHEETWIVLGLASGLAAYLLTMMTGDRNVLREDVAMFGAVAGLVALAAPLAGAAMRRRWVLLGLTALLLLAATVPVRVIRERQTIRLDRIESGLYGPEVSRGRTFRWTSGRARFHRSSVLRELTLSLRSLAPTPQTVSVRLDDQEIDRFTLTDHGWRDVHYQLPPGKAQSRYWRIELLVTPTWSPPDDPRDLGVQIGW